MFGGLLEGEGDADAGAGEGAGDVELAAEFADALAHAGEADSHARAGFFKFGKFFGGNTLAVILDGEGGVGVIGGEVNVHGFAAGVAQDVGEAFLEDAEEDQFGVFADGGIAADG